MNKNILLILSEVLFKKKKKEPKKKNTVFVEILEEANMRKDMGFLSTRHSFVKKNTYTHFPHSPQNMFL